MKKLYFLLIINFFLFTNCISQNKTDDIKELLQLIHSEEMINKVLDNVVSAVRQQASSELKDNQKLKEFMSFVYDEKNTLVSNLIDNDLVQIFDNYFSQDEILELLKFCNTTAGQKLIKLIPEIQKDLMDKVISKYGPDLQKKLLDKLNEIKYQ